MQHLRIASARQQRILMPSSERPAGQLCTAVRVDQVHPSGLAIGVGQSPGAYSVVRYFGPGGFLCLCRSERDFIDSARLSPGDPLQLVVLGQADNPH
jgi:hypothetical protein